MIAVDGKTPRGTVPRTADALHTTRDHVHHRTGHGAHYVFTVNANQHLLAARLKYLP
ncbi:hypothetical protein [Solihabitans fulvus]|uniref:hypothetical protein n=1 Tax=Solihabitans fulvus TaxID=1892852 RepID=UPI001661E070|nr:hypothetical protein [Solihabitans fulvus]